MSGLSKRDLFLFVMMFLAPFLSFGILTNPTALNDMLDEPINRVYYGLAASVIWLVIWAIALGIDNILKRKADKKENEDIEIDDPSLAYASYLFDKEK